MRAALLALAGAAAFVALGVITHHHREVGIDSAAFDVLRPLRGETGLDIVRVLTEIGSYPAVVAVAVAGGLHARRHGDPQRALALVAGVLLVYLLVTLTKHAWERPRPLGRFYDPQGHSFPSGHSAYAITWIAAAVLTGRRGLIVAAALVAGTIGMARLYLHVHYLTDVLGGFALGVAVYAPVLARTR